MVGGRPDDLIRYGHDLVGISRAVDEGRRRLVAGAQLSPRDLGTMTADTRIVGVLDRVLAAVDAAAGNVAQTARHDGRHLQQAASDLQAAPQPGTIEPVERGRVVGPVLGRAEPHRRGPSIDLQPSAPVMGHADPYHRGPTITDEPSTPVMGHADPYHRGPTITDETPGTEDS